CDRTECWVCSCFFFFFFFSSRRRHTRFSRDWSSDLCSSDLASVSSSGLVAVIVAEPPAFPVTSPLELTDATALLLEDQVTTRPVSGVPLASLGVALSCTVCPT